MNRRDARHRVQRACEWLCGISFVLVLLTAWFNSVARASAPLIDDSAPAQITSTATLTPTATATRTLTPTATFTTTATPSRTPTPTPTASQTATTNPYPLGTLSPTATGIASD